MADLNFTGIILGVVTFLTIGFFHPIVIKTEYYFGARPAWIAYLIGGLAAIVGSLLVEDLIVSTSLGVIAFSLLWSIGELFEQEKRVQRGWFPKNPKRKYPFDEEKK